MSALVHLGHALWGCRYSPHAEFTLLTHYLDEAIDPRFTVVCGWISSVSEWDRLLLDWSLLLASDKLSYFHMKEFSQFKKAFKKWEHAPRDRARFIHQATEIIRANVKHGVFCFVNHSEFALIDRDFELRERFASPYALAGRVCLSLADRWKERNYASEEMEYVFDDGVPASDKTALRKATTEAPSFGDPIFKPSRDIKDSKGRLRKGVVQIQTADFLAYELRKSRVERFERSTRPVRLSFYRLLGVDGFSMAMIHRGSITSILRDCGLDPLRKRVNVP